MKPIQVKEAKPYYFTEADTLWLSTPEFGQSGLSKFDFAYTGYTHIFPLQMPRFMEMQRPELTKSLEIMFARAATSFSGPSNLTLETGEVSDGIAANTLRMATKSNRDTADLSIRCLEMAGLPGRKFATDYIRGVNDPVTQIRDYLGAPETLKRFAPNHTFSFLIVQTDASLTEIQDAALYVNCVLLEADRSHVAWEKGSINVIEGTDFRFSCTEIVNQEVMEMAKVHLAKRRAIVNPDSFVSDLKLQ